MGYELLSNSKDIDYELCTGCGACYFRCPQNAIKMIKNPFGFYYPFVDNDRCTKCGLCESICRNIHNSSLHSPIDVYSAWSKNEQQHIWSTSGGVASTIYKKMFAKGWKIYGAKIVDLHNEFRIVEAKYEKDIELFSGSKYFQIPSFNSLVEIGNALKNGMSVLFIGTPCQTDAVKKIYEKKDNLYLIDLVCHGVPSLQFLKDELRVIGENNFSSLYNIRFREKGTDIRFIFKDGTNASISKNRSFYKRGFDISLTCRHSCCKCKYACVKRVGDISLGDFWGIEDKNKDKYVGIQSGINLVMVNTEKGILLWDAIKDNFVYEIHSIDEATLKNPQLNYAVGNSESRKVFFSQYERKGFINAIITAACANKKFPENYVIIFKYIVKLFLLKSIKRVDSHKG